MLWLLIALGIIIAIMFVLVTTFLFYVDSINESLEDIVDALDIDYEEVYNDNIDNE